MAKITPTPFAMKDATVTLGTNDFEAAVSSATLTPSPTVTTFKGLTPTAIYNVTSATTYTLDLTFAQSLAASDLSLYTFNNDGLNVPFKLVPVNGGPSFTGTLTLVATQIGGAEGSTATATVSFPVVGKPTLVPAS